MTLELLKKISRFPSENYLMIIHKIITAREIKEITTLLNNNKKQNENTKKRLRE